MRVVLITYRALQPLMEEYMHRHKKYFKLPVTLVAESDYSNGNYKHIKPPYGDPIENGDFGNSLRWALEKVKDKHVIIMLADYFITGMVNVKTIRKIAEYMTLKGDILRCDIGTNRGFGSIPEIDVYKGVSIREEKHFLATSLCPGIWDRKKLLAIMKGATAWDVELETNREFVTTGWRSIGTYPEPVDYENVIRGRNVDEFINMKYFLIKKG